jgi:hypothetical protein
MATKKQPVAKKQPPAKKRSPARAQSAGRLIDYPGLQTLSRRVQVKDIILHSANFELQAPPDLEGQGVLGFTFGVGPVRYSATAADRGIDVFLSFEIQGTVQRAAEVGRSDAETFDLFELRASWHVRYELESPLGAVDRETLGDFAFANGQLQAFPYLRAHVADITSKAGLPMLTLPVFRIPKERPRNVAPVLAPENA